MIFGARPIEAGEVRFDGRTLRLRSPADAVRAGIAYVPEDRVRQAAFLGMSLRENLSQASVDRYWRKFHLNHGAERADARRLIGSFRIRASSEAAPLDTLSGGNQQKVVLARWLRRRPRLLLLDDPTRGVDVGARAELYALLRDAVEEGASALIVCSELEELARVSDRVLVLDRGRIVAELNGPELSSERFSELVYRSAAIAA
jgi:ribose transport system ATP-binding protein